MIPVPSNVRVWLSVGRTDMRRGMTGLALQVQEALGRDPHAGDLNVFRGARGDLIKILYWIAVHPFDGDDKAVDELRPLGLFNGPADMEQTRGRLSVYAVKLLGRITGKITPE